MPQSILDIFFHKMPMAIAVFDADLRLRRCNPTWASYIASHGETRAQPETYFYDLLPGTQAIMHPYLTRALTGEVVQIDGLRLVSNEVVFYWDCGFAPWVEGGERAGCLLVATDVTERILSRQLLELRVRDRTRKLSALYEVMTVAAESLNVRDALQQMLGRVLVAVRATSGAIQVLDEAEERLHLVSQYGLTPEAAARLQNIAASTALAQWAATLAEPLGTEAPPALTDWRQESLVLRHAQRTHVATPMYARGRAVGLLSVWRESKRPFSQEDIALLDSVADHIAIAIENARLRHENEQLLVVEERNRLARELHDAVTQSLYSLTLFAETGQRHLEAGNLAQVRDSMGRVNDTAQQAIKEMRLLVHNLRPSILEKAGLDKALRQRLEAVERRAGMQTSLTIRGELSLPSSAEEGIYHIAQEALNNSLKHSSASVVAVRLTRVGRSLTLEVEDNGDGFDLAELDESGGLGVTSMQERVERLQGIVAISSARGQGTRVCVTLDLDKISEAEKSADMFTLLAGSRP
jgi:signal transduction histidine kinase